MSRETMKWEPKALQLVRQLLVNPEEKLPVLQQKDTTKTPETPLTGLIAEGRMEIQPWLADRILNEAHYERQRPLRGDQVRMLSNKLERGTLNEAGLISFARLGGKLFLVNGRHRMSAVAETGIPAGFHVAIEDVENSHELHELYRSFDRGIAVRTTHDVLAAEGVSDQFSIARKSAAAAWTALGLIMGRFKKPSETDFTVIRDDDSRLKFANDGGWWDVAAEYEKVIASATGRLRRKLYGAQVMAVGMVTLKHQPERAREFWSGLAANDGLRSGDPRRALIDALFAAYKKHGSNTHMAGVTAVAWNKFYANEAVQILRYFESRSIIVSGTPFNGL